MILGILQARVSSSRLPGKVLKPILGKPMLLRQIERLRRIKNLDGLLVATSVEVSDDPIEVLCRENNIGCFRGSLEDVLDRFYQAAKKYEPAHIVRFTGDCPLIDPEVVERLVALHLQGAFDYTSLTKPPTFPDGLDAEIFRYSVLERTWCEAILPSYREHVTPYIYREPSNFILGNLANMVNLAHLRWTVDNQEDMELVVKIYEALHTKKPNFLLEDILDFLVDNPYLCALNVKYKRNEGLIRSLKQDAFSQNFTEK